MNWKIVEKSIKNQPKTGTYSDWKEQIAKECFFQCVYCSIHEAQFGGIDHFHIDHFKPKGKFPEFTNDILNLFYSCPICNRFKGDDWPGEPDLHSPSYLNPSMVDYSELFLLEDNFEICGKNIASRFVILQLFLNRAQLIYERRESHRRDQETQLRTSINSLIMQLGEIDPTTAYDALVIISGIYSSLLALEQKKREIRPYCLIDIRRR